MAMTIPRLTRRDFSIGGASVFPVLTAASAKGDWDAGISQKAEAIHQLVTFKGNPKQVYEILLDAERFSRMTGGMGTEISRDVGGTFSLFNGQIKGRHLDLVPGELIVQAWRSESWKPHQYSIARFELSADGSGARLAFDHTGFPAGQAEHLAAGWRDHYWVPLEKYLRAG